MDGRSDWIELDPNNKTPDRGNVECLILVEVVYVVVRSLDLGRAKDLKSTQSKLFK